jgi:hypothetical protein
VESFYIALLWGAKINISQAELAVAEITLSDMDTKKHTINQKHLFGLPWQNVSESCLFSKNAYQVFLLSIRFLP